MIFVEKTELSDEETATTFNISSTQQEGASELVRQSGGEREREREKQKMRQMLLYVVTPYAFLASVC